MTVGGVGESNRVDCHIGGDSDGGQLEMMESRSDWDRIVFEL